MAHPHKKHAHLGRGQFSKRRHHKSELEVEQELLNQKKKVRSSIEKARAKKVK